MLIPFFHRRSYQGRCSCLVAVCFVCSSAFGLPNPDEATRKSVPENVVKVTESPSVSRYNVVWNTPSKNASGAMPIGNGDIAASVSAIENGDLYLLLAKNDAYNYDGDIFKTGRVRISVSPNPFEKGKPFRQTLDLATGSILIEADGVSFRIWADMNRPVFHVQINSPRSLEVSTQPDPWQRFDRCIGNGGVAYSKEPPNKEAPTQNVVLAKNGRLMWYYAVGDRSVFRDDLKYYKVPEMEKAFPDPYRFNTFGNLVECPQMGLEADSKPEPMLKGKGKSFDIRIHALTEQTSEPACWISDIEALASKPMNTRSDWKRHSAWWRQFWDRNWIDLSCNTLPPEERNRLEGEPGANDQRNEKDGAAVVAQAYNVFRFLMACQSRGKVMVKFNGGLFTQPMLLTADQKRSAPSVPMEGGYLTHPDDRRWGRRFTYQNERLLYWPLLASGDTDLMRPFFSYYRNLLPVRMAITKAIFGHDGAYYRENIEPTGAERDCGGNGFPGNGKPGDAATFYHDYYFTNGLETLLMMIDYYNQTGDTAFRNKTLLPFAREILRFYRVHWPKGPDGKIVFDPCQAIETWWRCTNPTPDIAGVQFCLDALIARGIGTHEDLAGWKEFRTELPAIPMTQVGGEPSIAIAEKYDIKKNSENPELYAVFPFRCFGVAEGTKDLVERTVENRVVKDGSRGGCWTQDQIDWAYAGNAKEAANGLEHRFRTASKTVRFPVFGDQGNDELPDFDHFGSGAIALQRMLVQESADGKIYLLPSWPANWDANFKLHLTSGGTIRGVVKEGKLQHWEIEPESRKAAVVVCKPQAIK